MANLNFQATPRASYCQIWCPGDLNVGGASGWFEVVKQATAQGSTTIMDDSAIIEFSAQDTVCDPLSDLLRKGAHALLRAAVEAERDAFLAEFAERRMPDGRAA